MEEEEEEEQSRKMVVLLKEEAEGLRKDLAIIRQEKLELHEILIETQRRLSDVQKLYARKLSDYKTICTERSFLSTSLELIKKELEAEKTTREALERRICTVSQHSKEIKDADPRVKELERTVLSRKCKRLEQDLKMSQKINEENLQALEEHKLLVNKLQRTIESMEFTGNAKPLTQVTLGNDWSHALETSELLLELQRRNVTIEKLSDASIRSKKQFLIRAYVFVMIAFTVSWFVPVLLTASN
eukprot:g15415.t1